MNDHSLSTWTDDGLVTVELTDAERHNWLVKTGYSDRIVTEVESVLNAAASNAAPGWRTRHLRLGAVDATEEQDAILLIDDKHPSSAHRLLVPTGW